MRNTLFTLALGGVLAFGATSALYAQDNSGQPQQQSEWGHGRHRMDPDAQLAHMTKALDLTPDQQSQIKPILMDGQEKMQALRQDQSVAREDRRSRMQAIQQDTQSRIEAVLNDQQKQKYEAMQERMRERRQQRMQGGENPPAGDSSQPQ